jgi:nitrogen fixation protein FixH
MSATKSSQLTGWHVLAITVGFFGVVIAVNSAFAFYALSTFPGEVSKTAYEDGLAYDKTLDARARQEALGWSAEVETDKGPGLVVAKFTDAKGAGLDGLVVSGALQRPATMAGARPLAFRALGRGLYQAQIAAPGGGWDLTLNARDSQGRTFAAERRIVWP